MVTEAIFGHVDKQDVPAAASQLPPCRVPSSAGLFDSIPGNMILSITDGHLVTQVNYATELIPGKSHEVCKGRLGQNYFCVGEAT